jgi:hypothetical protein
MGSIRLVIGSNIKKKFVGLIHLSKPILYERIVHSL